MIAQQIKSIHHDLFAYQAQLCVVTKKRNLAQIKEAILAGASIIGENQVQELEEKYDLLFAVRNQHNFEIHFIGHLQSNKVKAVVERCDLIQSVDSVKLLHKINRVALHYQKTQRVLLQINISQEPQKYGFGITELREVLTQCASLPNIHINGIMCMFSRNPEKVRDQAKNMKKLYDRFNPGSWTILSMGMSNDYRIALKEGSTMIRIGSKIFS